MSHHETDESDEVSGAPDASDPGPRPVVVRRNAGLAALVGAAASAVAIAYLWRATQSGAPLDWALCVLMALVAALHLAHLVDARTPLLVADDLGVRVRLGHQWRGLPWDAVDQVRVQPAHGPLHDGRLMFAPHSLGRALDGLDARGRRAAALNQRVYGAALAVPLGLGTRVPARGSALADALVALADGRSDVVQVEPAARARRSRRPESAEEAVDVPTAAGEVVAMPGWAAPEPSHHAGDTPGGTEGGDPEWVDAHAGDETVTWLTDRADASSEAPDDRIGDRLGDRLGDRWDDRADAGTEDGSESWADDVATESWAEDVATDDGTESWADDVATDDVESRSGEADTPGVDAESAPRVPRRSLLGRVGTAVSRVGRGRGRDVDSPVGDEGDLDEVAPGEVGPGEAELAEVAPTEERPGAHPPYDQDGHGQDGTGHDEPQHDEPEQDGPGDEADGVREAARPAARGTLSFREARHSLRAQIRSGRSAPVHGNAALLPDPVDPAEELPEGVTLRGGSSVDDGRVRPISTLGEPVEPLVVDEFVTEPAYDPVIGPELAAARTRVGLTVDELAERTRIRPHVIESIEVDDFAPCGGDFYARGHLRTLARVLGRDPAPLLEQFEKRYATAPISARRVFEAELATGMTGSMRSTAGGPNWLLLVGVVLALVLTWGVVRLFSSEPTETLQPVPALNGSAGIAAPRPGGGPAVAPVAAPLRVELVGAHAGTEVVVRDRAHTVVWAGRVELGGHHTVRATPPVTVNAEDAGAVEVTVAGVDRGPLGQLGRPGEHTYRRAG